MNSSIILTMRRIATPLVVAVALFQTGCTTTMTTPQRPLTAAEAFEATKVVPFRGGTVQVEGPSLSLTSPEGDEQLTDYIAPGVEERIVLQVAIPRASRSEWADFDRAVDPHAHSYQVVSTVATMARDTGLPIQEDGHLEWVDVQLTLDDLQRAQSEGLMLTLQGKHGTVSVTYPGIYIQAVLTKRVAAVR